MLAEEAPKVTDWMQAWGSLAGLVMSTAAVIFTGLLFRHEIRVRREEKQDAEASQARLVVATLTGMAKSFGSRGGHDMMGYRIMNLSSAPILDVTIRHIWENNPMGPPHRIPILVGEEEGQLPVWRELGTPFKKIIEEASYVEILFTDANGHKWKRVHLNSPVRVVPRQYTEPSLARVMATLAAGVGVAAALAALITDLFR
ncbi:hypothetical protein [Micromonospora sp. NPDC050200]|uniref:hypothetical protein n=1 Tax=Micromonospora sp. NPDC050200 TaxID=3155664 RepID=UPI0033E865AB